MPENEQRLVRALLRREHEAWTALYDQHVRAVFGVAYHLSGGDRALAEEVSQEVWAAAIEQVEQFDSARGNLRGWLLGIARHRALRKRRRGRVLVGQPPPEEASGSPGPPDQLEGLERAEVVRAALLCLEDDRRQVLLEKYVERHSVAEIAARTGRTAKAVEALLSRARAELRGLLAPYTTNPDPVTNPTGGDRHAARDTRPAH